MQKTIYIYHIIVAVLLVAQSEYAITKEPYFHKVYAACLDEVSKSGHDRSTLEREYLFLGKLAACLAQQSKHSENASIKNKLVAISEMINKELLDNGGIDEYNSPSLISELIIQSEQEEQNNNKSMCFKEMQQLMQDADAQSREEKIEKLFARCTQNRYNHEKRAYLDKPLHLLIDKACFVYIAANNDNAITEHTEERYVQLYNKMIDQIVEIEHSRNRARLSDRELLSIMRDAVNLRADLDKETFANDLYQRMIDQQKTVEEERLNIYWNFNE